MVTGAIGAQATGSQELEVDRGYLTAGEINNDICRLNLGSQRTPLWSMLVLVDKGFDNSNASIHELLLWHNIY